MGNENAKEIPISQETCENGGMNGISLTITANGYTVEVPTKIPTENNEEPPLPDMKTDSRTTYSESESGPLEAEVPVQTLDVFRVEFPPTEHPVSLFSKMLKKKTATEKDMESDEDQKEAKTRNDEQIPNGKIHEKEESGPVNGITASDTGIQVPFLSIVEQSLQTESTEYVVLESQPGQTEIEVSAQTPDLSVLIAEIPQKEERASLFSKIFKKKTATTEKDKQPERESNEDQSDINLDKDNQQNGENHGVINENTSEPPSQESKTESTDLALESQSGPTKAEAIAQTPDLSIHSEEVPQREEQVSLFSKMFKKKTTPAPTTATTEKEQQPEKETEEMGEDQADTGPNEQSLETDHLKPDTQVVEGECVLDQTEEEESELGGGSGKLIVESQDSHEEDNPVMNFFKSLVTPSKTPKKEAPGSDVPKVQDAQMSDPTAAPKGMPAPPPPPPEPPRAEPATKVAKQEENNPAIKDSSKGKSATLTRLFRSKRKHKDSHPSEEEAQMEQVQKPDASKASTLEAAAKPAAAMATAPEEKKPEAKKSFLSFLKPKTVEPKAAPAPAAAAVAEPGPAKEDPPKAAKAPDSAEAKATTAVPSGGDEVASAPKKLEKRNSITLFFKNLSQKRGSTDAGSTEAAPSVDKTK